MKTSDQSPERPVRRSRRRWPVAVAVLAGLAGASAATAGAATSGSSPVACFWTPAADVLGFGPELAATVRMSNGEIEILHRVRCTGRPEHWQWMSAHDAGAVS
jgi:hypothetical protein